MSYEEIQSLASLSLWKAEDKKKSANDMYKTQKQKNSAISKLALFLVMIYGGIIYPTITFKIIKTLLFLTPLGVILKHCQKEVANQFSLHKKISLYIIFSLFL